MTVKEVAIYVVTERVAEVTRAFAPGNESWREFLERVRATLDRLAARFAGQTMLTVPHTGFKDVIKHWEFLTASGILPLSCW
jgi:broad specificity phosphatase PhoE